MFAWAAYPRSADLPALAREVVDHHVLADLPRRGVERAALVDLGHALDEAHQLGRVVEHEGVDRDALAGHAADLAERLLVRARAGPAHAAGPFDPQLVADEVRRRLAVGDHDDLLVHRR